MVWYKNSDGAWQLITYIITSWSVYLCCVFNYRDIPPTWRSSFSLPSFSSNPHSDHNSNRLYFRCIQQVSVWYTLYTYGNIYLSTILSSYNEIIMLLNLRYAYTPKQVRNKPGREVVTFLLVCNLAMWAINTLETNRADSHPIQVIIVSIERIYGI